MAGTLIIRFRWPADHCRPSRTYSATRLACGQVQLRVLQQRIDLETDVAVVAAGLLPDGQEDLLGVADQLVGHLPGDLAVVEPLPHQPLDVRVEPSGGHQIGHDDRVGRCAGGARGSIRADQVGVDRVEPEFRAGGQQGFDGIWHGQVSP